MSDILHFFNSVHHASNSNSLQNSRKLARAIRLGGLSTGEAVALVPYADLFNHNPFANSYIDARQQGFFSKTDEVVVYADRSYKKMEQVCPVFCVRLCSTLSGSAWVSCVCEFSIRGYLQCSWLCIV